MEHRNGRTGRVGMNEENRGTEAERLVACPFCNSIDTEMIALFGMQMMTSQYYCRNCHSVFEAIKWDAPRGGNTEGQSDS